MNQNDGAPMVSATNTADSNADFNINIQDQLGVPPAPPIPDFLSNDPIDATNTSSVMADLTNMEPTPITNEPVAGSEPAVTSVNEPVMQNGNTAIEATAAVTPVETAPIETGSSVTEEMNADQFENVKKQMLQDLYPLMDKIKMQPEQKFKVFKQMIESTGSKEMIASAYEAVKGIGNEEARAEALLFLVEKADS
ncbi:MAG: hypothetical protein ACFNPW_02725 [Candidatus Nanosyncoccus sp.]